MKSHSPPADENLLELIPEHCPDLLALLDVNGLFLYGNAAHFLRLPATGHATRRPTPSQ